MWLVSCGASGACGVWRGERRVRSQNVSLALRRASRWIGAPAALAPRKRCIGQRHRLVVCRPARHYAKCGRTAHLLVMSSVTAARTRGSMRATEPQTSLTSLTKCSQVRIRPMRAEGRVAHLRVPQLARHGHSPGLLAQGATAPPQYVPHTTLLLHANCASRAAQAAGKFG